MQAPVELFAIGSRGTPPARSARALESVSLEPLPLPGDVATAQQAIESLGLPPGIYTAMRTFDGDRFLCLREHLERLDRSVSLAGWEDPPVDRELLRRALAEAVGAPPEAVAGEWNLRIDLLPAGHSVPGLDTRWLLARWPHRPVPEPFRRSGVRLGLATELDRPNPRVKAAEFAIRRHPYPLVTRDAFDHLLLDPEGRILEATSANVYVVQGGTLLTAGRGVLEGITRRLVLELAVRAKIPVRPEAPPLSLLPTCQEAFLSSSTRGILPVIGIGEAVLGDGTPGPITRRLAADLARESFSRARPAWPPPVDEEEAPSHPKDPVSLHGIADERED